MATNSIERKAACKWALVAATALFAGCSKVEHKWSEFTPLNYTSENFLITSDLSTNQTGYIPEDCSNFSITFHKVDPGFPPRLDYIKRGEEYFDLIPETDSYDYDESVESAILLDEEWCRIIMTQATDSRTYTFYMAYKEENSDIVYQTFFNSGYAILHLDFTHGKPAATN